MTCLMHAEGVAYDVFVYQYMTENLINAYHSNMLPVVELELTVHLKLLTERFNEFCFTALTREILIWSATISQSSSFVMG